MSSKRKIKKIIQRLKQRKVKGIKRVEYYYKMGKYIHRHGEVPEKLDYRFRRGAHRVYLYFRNRPLALKPTYKELCSMKEDDFLHFLGDKESSTKGILSGTSHDVATHDSISHDLIDQQDEIAPVILQDRNFNLEMVNHEDYGNQDNQHCLNLVSAMLDHVSTMSDHVSTMSDHVSTMSQPCSTMSDHVSTTLNQTSAMSHHVSTSFKLNLNISDILTDN